MNLGGDHFIPDMASELDTPAERLAEELGCAVPVAERVIAWQERQSAAGPMGPAEVSRQAQAMVADILVLLVKPTKNIRAWVWGLIFAAGLADKNGGRSMAEVARQLRLTRATISHYAREWRRNFPDLVNMFNARGEGTVARCRAARVKAVGRGNERDVQRRDDCREV